MIEELYAITQAWLQGGGFPEGEPLSFQLEYDIVTDTLELQALAGMGQVKSAKVIMTVSEPTQSDLLTMEQYTDGLNRL